MDNNISSPYASSSILKHTTTILASSDRPSREWRVIVDQVQTNYHGRPVVL